MKATGKLRTRSEIRTRDLPTGRNGVTTQM